MKIKSSTIALIILVVILIIWLILSKHQNSTLKTILPQSVCWDGSIKGDRCRPDPTHKSLSDFSSITFPITRKPSLIEEDSGNKVSFDYGITIKLELFNPNTKNKKSEINVIVDTGSYDLIVQTSKVLEKLTDIYNINTDGNKEEIIKQQLADAKDIRENGFWEYGGSCLIKGKSEYVSYGGGSVSLVYFNSYLLNGKEPIGLNIQGALDLSQVYENICGFLPGGEYDDMNYGFINYICDGLSNCKRGFTIDLKKDQLTIGSVDTSGIKIPIIPEDVLKKKIYVNGLYQSIPFYIIYLDSINGVKPEQEVFVILDSGTTFMEVSNDYTLQLITKAIGVKNLNDTTTHNKISLSFMSEDNRKATLTSSVPFSLERSGKSNDPFYYINLKCPYSKSSLYEHGYGTKQNIIVCGVNFQFDTVIGYDLDERMIYITS
jgi:hypothetical protein